MNINKNLHFKAFVIFHACHSRMQLGNNWLRHSKLNFFTSFGCRQKVCLMICEIIIIIIRYSVSIDLFHAAINGIHRPHRPVK